MEQLRYTHSMGGRAVTSLTSSHNSQSFTSAASLFSQFRNTYTAIKKDNSDLVAIVKGFEQDPELRRLMTSKFKSLGLRWSPDQDNKGWIPSRDIHYSDVQAIIQESKASIPTGFPVSTSSSSKYVTRVEDLIKKWEAELVESLPRGIEPKRFLTSLKAALLTSEKVVNNSSEASIYKACIRSAQQGLTPGINNECYFSSREGEIEFLIGYKGIIALARRSIPGIDIEANVVRTGDEFSYSLGTNPRIEFSECYNSEDDSIDDREIERAYVRIIMPDGATKLTVIDKDHVKKRKDCSKGANSPTSPWKKFPREMWMKTAIRDAFRFMNLNPDINQKEDAMKAIAEIRHQLSIIDDELTAEGKS